MEHEPGAWPKPMAWSSKLAQQKNKSGEYEFCGIPGFLSPETTRCQQHCQQACCGNIAQDLEIVRLYYNIRLCCWESVDVAYSSMLPSTGCRVFVALSPLNFSSHSSNMLLVFSRWIGCSVYILEKLLANKLLIKKAENKGC